MTRGARGAEEEGGIVGEGGGEGVARVEGGVDGVLEEGDLDALIADAKLIAAPEELDEGEEEKEAEPGEEGCACAGRELWCDWINAGGG